ncbi:catechol 2,3-dioxygenase-like lactoylglutathione lyase family enzyme [Pseudonocardia sediminis]|uniref:Catechol 2,3-dioxygenase-like lactoylglutathione lyase family enzyme n=1 Tax=Pseudonocardia sediminis TaxID=1397368 RepID=A0A4Q7UVY8_PSEST|nr:VOC family protein [Pseudonocardia sediminis]RZT84229.1 catechol 2,3-dioxygenase-like lactoylglutathione lyase family enzyme [Pseudonocardia sediminis]
MTQTAPPPSGTGRPPIRLHHNAFVTKDQERTRAFYEDVIGMPLVATWTEVDELFGAERVYCHTFFALADGSALAFFQFANPEDQELFDPELTPSPFRHIALATDRANQDAIRTRIADAGYVEPQTFVLDHGYCVSLYITDPNGLLLEFTVDDPDADAINEVRRAHARKDLERWLGGDHSSNNTYRD